MLTLFVACLSPLTLPFGELALQSPWLSAHGSSPHSLPPTASLQGYACSAKESQLAAYTNVTLRAVCPDDWFETQHLIYVNHCYALPRRKCMGPTPANPTEVRRATRGWRMIAWG